MSDQVAPGPTTGIDCRIELSQDDGDVVGFRKFADANNRGDILDITIAVRPTARF